MDGKHLFYMNGLLKDRVRVIVTKFYKDDENNNSLASRSNTMGGFTVTPTAPQMTDVILNRCGEAVR